MLIEWAVMTLSQYLQTCFGIYSRVQIFPSLINHFVFHCANRIVSVHLWLDRTDFTAETSLGGAFPRADSPLRSRDAESSGLLFVSVLSREMGTRSLGQPGKPWWLTSSRVFYLKPSRKARRDRN